MFFDDFVAQSWYVCVDSSGGALDRSCIDTFRVCNFASYELIDGVVEFLHRERRHCVWVDRSCPRVRVRVSSSSCSGAPRFTRQPLHNALSDVLVGAGFVLHVSHDDFLAYGVDGSSVFDSTDVAPDACDLLASFVVVDRAYLLIHRLGVFLCVCLHVVLSCVSV